MSKDDNISAKIHLAVAVNIEKMAKILNKCTSVVIPEPAT